MFEKENKYLQKNYNEPCGTSLTCIFQPETSTLYIKGYGEMFDYKNEEGSLNPLYSHNYFNASKIIITDGVTSIGDFSFYKCSALNSIEIPATRFTGHRV